GVDGDSRVLRGQPGTDEYFGGSVAVAGDWLFTSAIYDDGAQSLGGKVYAWHRVGGAWQLAQAIAPPVPEASLFLGFAMVARDDLLLLGASGARQGNGDRTGGVFVYRLVAGQWQLATSILPTEYFPDARFGRSLALDGQHLAIGAPTFAPAVAQQGAVYVYRASSDFATWTLEKRIVHGPASANRSLGYSVELRGDTLVASDGRSRTWVFERDRGGAAQWGLLQDLSTESVGTPTPRMLAFDGSTIALGQQVANVNGVFFAGRVRIYRRTGPVDAPWQLAQVVTDVGGVANGNMLGTAVTLADGLLYATGNYAGASGLGEGATLRVFRPDATGRFRALGTAVVRGLPDPPNFSPDLQDLPVAVAGDEIVIGIGSENGANPQREDVGAAYVFRRELDLFDDGFED
ncbi:MAG TPA: hypothetical protein VFL14_16065, partial [Xanthomonadales bacterium]|nr:hypothetical protein [Xanthomonadales bacterium]